MAQIRGRGRRPSVGIVAGLAALGLVAGAAGCGGDDGASGAAGRPDRPLVVVTTSILGDVVHEVAGDHLEVQVLMGAGVDPHEYQASARDAERIRRADLVVVNGGHLEGSLLDAVDAAQQAGVDVFSALDHTDPRPLEADGDHADDHADDHGDLDPHFWQDPRRMALVVDALGPVLAGLAPNGDGVVAGAGAYAAELRAIDADDEQRLGALPPERRKLVTDHDAFGYFADRYGFTIVGVIIPGGGTSGQASARDLADLADAVTRADVPAIFSENTLSARTADALAREAGHEVAVVQLFSDALGLASSGATTYADLVRTNTDRILDALG